jgi:hypothetical protein
LFCVIFVGKYIRVVIASLMLTSIFPGFLKASIPKKVPKCNFVLAFFVHLSIMKEGTHPIVCSPKNHLLFCWCFQGFVVGITQFILDTFSKVPLYLLSEVHNLYCHLVWTQFDFAGYMGVMILSELWQPDETISSSH